MNTISRSELIDKFIDSINEPVIVEGKKDKLALESLGVKNVIQLNQGGSILEVIEALADFPSIVILTDMDRAGKVLRKKILRYFKLYGIYENKKPREFFAQMRLSHIEGLSSWMRDEKIFTSLEQV